MVQTLVLVILFLAGAVFVQTNMPSMESQIPLIVAGVPDLKLTYLNLMVAVGGMLVLVWLAGLVDIAELRGRLRRRAAAIQSKDQEITRIKAVAHDQHEAAMADIRGRFEVLAQEISSRLGRIEQGLSLRPERIAQTPEVTPDAPRRTVREEVTIHSER